MAERKEVEIHGLDELLARMRALPIYAKADRNSPFRWGLVKAADVIEKGAQRLAPRDTGAYAKGIKKRYQGKRSNNAVLVYTVSPRNKTQAFALEYGTGVFFDGEVVKPERAKVLADKQTREVFGAYTRGQKAQPHMRPAFYMFGKKAIYTFSIEASRKFDRLIAKLRRLKR